VRSDASEPHNRRAPESGPKSAAGSDAPASRTNVRPGTKAAAKTMRGRDAGERKDTKRLANLAARIDERLASERG